MDNEGGYQSSSSYNTTESGMWENERDVCEMKRSQALEKAASLPTQNATEYLPQFIARRFGDDIPLLTDSCSLKAKFRAKSGVMEYQYTVSWFEDGPHHQRILNMDLSKPKHLVPATNKKKKVESEVPGPKAGDCKRAPKTLHQNCCPEEGTKVAKPFSAAQPVHKNKPSSVGSTVLRSEHSTISSPSHDIMVNVAKKTGSEPQVRLCDGPCAQMRSIQDLRILGRCDHAICALCVVNAPMVSQEDGSMGCCNKRCFASDLVNQIPDSKRRHELYQLIFKGKNYEEIFKLYKGDIRREKMERADLSECTSYASLPKAQSAESKVSTVSGCSYTSASDRTNAGEGIYELPPPSFASAISASKASAIEMLLMNLTVLESSYFSTLRRHRFQQEMPSKLPLLAAVEALMGVSASRNLSNSITRIFYSPNGSMDPSEMLEIDAKKHGTLTMRDFANRGVCSFLIDYTGKLVKDKRPFYTKEATVKATNKK